ncbi:MAG: hypothetical protein A2Y00_07750 [Omnitrophica WOR_2 bacterium GWF2_43_52]|nr:MAG: hypothetical protein A2Y00_07750 [Omnitrophica WOR_2 bacterium GWF2_43_52]OGX56570.1 MAG: hypothetical protein A2460_03075 [Omnitrophica WOR_2 bacterium RIFOXYC2_FULL_43_9]HAH22042.1 hypothetical protein [Candidatus Omnitrophota bacterium]HBG62719.1 hypothetical protein [Candidatus Omnitrophota bacterium]
MDSYKNKNNKGVALIMALGVSSVLLTLSMAYVGGAIQESNLSQRYQDSMTALYEAERGLAYAFGEAQNAGYDWFTHDVDSNDANRNGDTTEFIRPANSPGVTLGDVRDNQGIVINSAGNYQIPLGGASLIQVRSYTNPNDTNQMFLMAQATVGSASRTLKTKIIRRPLFKYFYYYPGWKYFEGSDFDGEGIGGVYVKDGITLRNVNFKNITELATGPNGYIVAASDQYTSPKGVDWFIGGINGKAPLPSKYDSSGQLVWDDGYNGNNPWGQWRWPPQYSFPWDWRRVYDHFFNPGTVNKVTLPTKDDAVNNLWPEWQWNKYPQSDNSEVPVQFCNPCGERDINGDGVKDTVYATPQYWAAFSEARCGAGKTNNECGLIDPDFWRDKIYDRQTPTEMVRYLHTKKQAGAWQGWVNSATIPLGQDQYNEGQPLSSVVKEGQTGGYDIEMPKIDQNYAGLAKKDGLYIGEDGVYLNGSPDSLPSCIRDNVEFFNTLRPQDRNGDGTLDPENVLEINIEQCRTTREVPNNGIIYVAHKNLRLTNAKQMPDNGLTVASPYNIYIKGNYNYDPSNDPDTNDRNWRPSAVISNSYVYILSGNFTDPQALPDYVVPREYPYETTRIASNIDYNNATQRATLQNKVQTYFGLPNFTMAGVNSKTGLESKIRSQHASECSNTMPNIASPTTVRSAIVSPKDMTGVSWDENKFYQLERWPTNPVLRGAFILLGESWVKDNEGNDIQDIPIYGYDWQGVPINTPRSVRRGTGGSATIDKGEDVMWINTPGSKLKYEYLFDTDTMPPGNLAGGTEAGWQEVSDFNHS